MSKGLRYVDPDCMGSLKEDNPADLLTLCLEARNDMFTNPIKDGNSSSRILQSDSDEIEYFAAGAVSTHSSCKLSQVSASEAHSRTVPTMMFGRLGGSFEWHLDYF